MPEESLPITTDDAPAGERSHVLVVDDSPVDRRLVGKILAKRSDLQVTFAEDGRQALDALAASLPDIVLTDVQMPELDGLSLVAEVRDRYPLVPTVIMTAHGSEDMALMALRRGAVSYVPKRHLARDLLETIDSILAAASFDRQQRRLQEYWLQTEFRFRMESDASAIPWLVAHVQQYLRQRPESDETEVIRVGVALHEALTNAVFHGNLELDSQLRHNDSGEYYELALARQRREPYCNRRVHVVIRESPHEGRYVVRDEGPGFDHRRMMPDPTDPAHLQLPSGRGLFLIRTFMHEVQHNEKGNEITMLHRHQPARQSMERTTTNE